MRLGRWLSEGVGNERVSRGFRPPCNSRRQDPFDPIDSRQYAHRPAAQIRITFALSCWAVWPRVRTVRPLSAAMTDSPTSAAIDGSR